MKRRHHMTAADVLASCSPAVRAANPHLFGGEAAGPGGKAAPSDRESRPAPEESPQALQESRAGSGGKSPPPPPPLRRGRQPNKTEQRWLDELARDPTVKRVRYEPIKLKLADGVTYTPDFFIEYQDGSTGFDEVKGPFVRDAARSKYQIAREMFPSFRWRWCQWAGGQWNVTEQAGKARLTEASEPRRARRSA